MAALCESQSSSTSSSSDVDDDIPSQTVGVKAYQFEPKPRVVLPRPARVDSSDDDEERHEPPTPNRVGNKAW